MGASTRMATATRAPGGRRRPGERSRAGVAAGSGADILKASGGSAGTARSPRWRRRGPTGSPVESRRVRSCLGLLGLREDGRDLVDLGEQLVGLGRVTAALGAGG